MSGESQVTITVAPDQRSVEFVAHLRGGRSADLRLTAEELDTVLLALQSARARMIPAYPATADGVEISYVDSYAWTTSSVRADGARPVAWRHPILGWIGFLMPDGDAAELASCLTGPILDDTPQGAA